MIHFGLSAIVIFVLALVVMVFARFQPRDLRPYLWIAFLEYMACAGAQMIYSRIVVEGGDLLLYSHIGSDLVKFLENTDYAWRELFSLLIQQPSIFDAYAYGGTNTGSMCAMSAFLLYFLGGSDYAVHVFVSGLSLIGALGIFSAFRDACPDVSEKRLFAATVLFPSVAFWTSALHKESFGLIGIGAMLYGWRCLYHQKWIRFCLFGTLGTALVVLFRAPILPPLMLGVAAYIVLERLQKVRGADAVLIGPLYVAIGAIVLAFGLVVMSRVSPKFSLDQLSETIALKQQGWSRGGTAGSTFDAGDDVGSQSLGAQLQRVPIALLNALFRPQLFDVRNLASLLSAIEMTAVTVLIILALRRRGIGGFITTIQKSPLLVMCSLITLIGCMFVGLVTLNFGSLVRYRVPFLPFYGTLVMILAERRRRPEEV